MTDDELTEWRERLERAVEAWVRERQQRAALRRQLDRRRAHGLERRHRDKLARRDAS